MTPYLALNLAFYLIIINAFERYALAIDDYCSCFAIFSRSRSKISATTFDSNASKGFEEDNQVDLNKPKLTTKL